MAQRAQASRRSLRRGFTLIELLVVIAIMMLLLGLIAPGLANARRNAQAVACLNNLRQIGTAIRLYCDENNDRIAGWSGLPGPTWSNTSSVAWTRSIFPYLNSTEVFQDPGWPSWMQDLPVSYYLNLLPAAVRSNEVPSQGAYSLDLRAIRYPSAFILVSEDLSFDATPEIDPTNEMSDRTGFSGVTNAPPVHGKANFLFADGHVASFKQWDASAMTYWYHTMSNWSSTVP